MDWFCFHFYYHLNKQRWGKKYLDAAGIEPGFDCPGKFSYPLHQKIPKVSWTIERYIKVFTIVLCVSAVAWLTSEPGSNLAWSHISMKKILWAIVVLRSKAWILLEVVSRRCLRLDAHFGHSETKVCEPGSLKSTITGASSRTTQPG